MINYDIYKGKNTSQSGFSLTIPGLTGIDFEPRQEKNLLE